jgi:hypothetical protein
MQDSLSVFECYVQADTHLCDVPVLFTSPHLVRLNERIRVNGRPISDEALATHFWDLWDRLQQVVTFLRIVFRPQKADIPTRNISSRRYIEVPHALNKLLTVSILCPGLQAQVPADEPPPVPGFFRLLTLLGFWVAVREKVRAHTSRYSDE